MADESTRVRIAITNARELQFDVEDVRSMTAAIEEGLAGGTDIVWITDIKGDRHGLRVQNLAFIEVEGDAGPGGVGFGL